MSKFARMRAGIAAVVTGAALAATVAVSAPATAAVSALRSDCGVGGFRVSNGALSTFEVTASGFAQSNITTLNFNGANTQPIAMALTRVSTVNPDLAYFHAATSDGVLWRLTINGATGSVGATKIKTSGFGGVKSMVLGDSGLLYVLYNTGTLARYTLDGAGKIVGAKLIAAAPGWKFARSMRWAPGGVVGGVKVDTVAVLTTGDNLNEYMFRVDNGTVKAAATLKTGWSAYATTVLGGCTNDSGVPVYGITKSFNGYAWFDRNGFNLSGTDMVPAGQYGTGLSGLIFE